MSRIGRYCKAYHIAKLREFPSWAAGAKPITASDPPPDEDAEDGEPRFAERDDYVFLHDDYTVTQGIFMDDRVIFAEVTDEWKRFCGESLGFAVPADEELGSDEGRAEPKLKEAGHG